jgi:trehalose/maltose hydrolase-like predicted phosphorylase
VYHVLQCAHPNQEDHLSADISVAVRQYYRATGDKKWLASKGLPLVLGSSPSLPLHYALAIAHHPIRP